MIQTLEKTEPRRQRRDMESPEEWSSYLGKISKSCVLL